MLESLSGELQMEVCNCVRHAVDWFRTLVNIFCGECSSNNSQHVENAIKRWNQLVDVENLLYEISQRCPAFVTGAVGESVVGSYNTTSGSFILCAYLIE